MTGRSSTGTDWSAHGIGAIVSAIDLVVVVVLVLTKMRGQELQPRTRLLGPLIIIVAGIATMVPQAPENLELHAIDYIVGTLDVALSVILGAIRGFTVRIYRRDQTWWYRYGPATVTLWAVSIVLRVVLMIFGAHHGAISLITNSDLLAMLGLTLLIQNVTVLARTIRLSRPCRTDTEATKRDRLC